MGVKKRPVSPRQKMINLMYIVLLAMLALNVSNEVLKGFDLVGSSLLRTTENAVKENEGIYANLDEQLKVNPTKVKPWHDKAQQVKRMSDSLYNFAAELRLAIAREADGKEANPDDIQNKEDLEAAGHIMLAPVRGKGRELYNRINNYREQILTMITDARQRSIIASNLSTDVPKTANNIGKSWEEYMFEAMPSVAAVTMLTKLQSDIRNAEGEVLHTLVSNIDLKDVRVNEINAYVLPEATTLFPGETFKSHIFMAAVDTTQRPEIYINGKRIADNGDYSFTVGAPGEYSFTGYMRMPNAAGEMIQREFSQKYNVIPAPTGATVAADMMNVLYAGFDNPMSVSASGVSANKISVTMEGGRLEAKGNGKYIARPETVGKDVTFTVTGVVNGASRVMGKVSFQVRKLPDPTAYIKVDNDRYKGGSGLSKAKILAAEEIGAAIDDGLLNIPFKVLSFEAVFHDRMGNVRPEVSKSAAFTEEQRELIRTMRRGARFYISKVRVIGPDGIERTLPQALEVIIN